MTQLLPSGDWFCKGIKAGVATLLAITGIQASASSPKGFLDFDTAPYAFTGPRVFIDSSPVYVTAKFQDQLASPQEWPYLQVSLDGGTILTSPTYLPYADAANLKSVYATANIDGVRTYPSTIGIHCIPGCNSVSGVLMNGLTTSVTYDFRVVSEEQAGGLHAYLDFPVTHQVTLASNMASGMTTFSFTQGLASPIALLIIAPHTTPNGLYDFIVDGLAFNQEFSTANAANIAFSSYAAANSVPLASVPEPSKDELIIVGAILIGISRYRHNLRTFTKPKTEI